MRKFFITIVLLLLIPSIAFAQSFHDGFKRFRSVAITVSAAHAEWTITEDIGDFPTDMLETDGDDACQVDGGDIVFSSDSAGATQLPLHVIDISQNATPASATIEMHVKAGTSTTIYMWWKTTVATSQPDSDATYGSDAVWSDYVYATDATIDTLVHNLTGTSLPGAITGTVTETTGKIDGGLDFQGSTDYVTIADNSAFSFGTLPFTISLWCKADALGENKQLINKRGSSGDLEWMLQYVNAATGFSLQLYDQSTGGYIKNYPSGSVTTATWYNVVAVFDGGTSEDNIHTYINASDETNVAILSGTYAGMEDLTHTVIIGTQGWSTATQEWNGIIDEIRIASVARDSTWVGQEYAMENNQATWADCGTVQTTASESANTWYVRPLGGTYGDEDGTSYANAFDGWSDIVWSSVTDNDTLYICGTHLPGLEVSKIFNEKMTIRGDYPGDPGIISGLTTVNNANWSNVSGDLYKVEITAPTWDYEQGTEPGSPSDEEQWFVNGKFSVATGKLIEWDDTDSEWEPVNGFHHTDIVYVDGTKTEPARFESSAGTGTTTVLTHADLSEADDYWIGSIAYFYTQVWQMEARIITDSADAANSITFPETNYTPTAAPPNLYLEMIPPDLIDTEFEWTCRNESGTNYLYMEMTDDTAQTVEYATGYHGILLKDCQHVAIQNLSIRDINGEGIVIFQSGNIEISRISIKKFVAPTFLSHGGGIAVYGGCMISDDWDNEDRFQHPVTIDSCSISDIIGGSNGVFISLHDDCSVRNSFITDMRTEPYPKGKNSGVFGLRSDNIILQHNTVTYIAYTGLFINRSDDFLIDNNISQYCMYDYSDGGCIMTYMCDSGDISNNRIEHLDDEEKNRGIYLDLQSDYNTIEDNYFYDMPPSTTSLTAALRAQNVVSPYSTHNDFLNNMIYDADCTIGEGITVNDNTDTDNDRYTETDYPFLNVNAAALLTVF